MAKKETTNVEKKKNFPVTEIRKEPLNADLKNVSEQHDNIVEELDKLKLEYDALLNEFGKVDGENTELITKVETLEKIVLETTSIRDVQVNEIQTLKNDNEKLIENETKIVEDRNLLLQQISDLEAELTETKEKLEKYEKRRESQIKPKQGVVPNGYFNGNMYGNNYGMY